MEEACKCMRGVGERQQKLIPLKWQKSCQCGTEASISTVDAYIMFMGPCIYIELLSARPTTLSLLSSYYILYKLVRVDVICILLTPINSQRRRPSSHCRCPPSASYHSVQTLLSPCTVVVLHSLYLMISDRSTATTSSTDLDIFRRVKSNDILLSAPFPKNRLNHATSFGCNLPLIIFAEYGTVTFGHDL